MRGSEVMTEEIKRRFCDICKKPMEKKIGKLHFYMPIRDYMGNFCAGENLNYEDVCEDCCKKIDKFIVDLIKEVKLVYC